MYLRWALAMGIWAWIAFNVAPAEILDILTLQSTRGALDITAGRLGL